jgi:hypothetical protein
MNMGASTRPIPQKITLKVANTMFTETVENIKNSAWLTAESRNQKTNCGPGNLKTRQFTKLVPP